MEFVRQAADLSERGMPKSTRAAGDPAVIQWFREHPDAASVA
jgi:hypothetical protein